MTGAFGLARRSAKVVIVEDNPITRKVLRVALESEGYQVAESGDGQTALALVESTRPDLVLLDYVLPDMTGETLGWRIRQTPHGRDLPIVLLSGQSSEIDTAGSPFDACLLKPYEPSRLLQQLDGLLTAHTVPSARRTGNTVEFPTAALRLMSAISDV